MNFYRSITCLWVKPHNRAFVKAKTAHKNSCFISTCIVRKFLYQKVYCFYQKIQACMSIQACYGGINRCFANNRSPHIRDAAPQRQGDATLLLAGISVFPVRRVPRWLRLRSPYGVWRCVFRLVLYRGKSWGRSGHSWHTRHNRKRLSLRNFGGLPPRAKLLFRSTARPYLLARASGTILTSDMMLQPIRALRPALKRVPTGYDV